MADPTSARSGRISGGALDTLCAAAVDHECRDQHGYKARQEQRPVELLAEEKEKQRPAGRRGSDQRRHQPAQAAA